MRFSLFAVVGLVAAVQAQNVCFDAGDCLFSSAGKQCIKKAGSITGTCGKAGATSTLKTTTKSAAPGKPTGAVCFDDFDCFLTGGTCVRTGSAFTGQCTKKGT